MNQFPNIINKYAQVPCDLYIKKADAKRMEHEGSEEVGYLQVADTKDYIIISKHAFQPAIKLNDNSFLVTFIMK